MKNKFGKIYNDKYFKKVFLFEIMYYLCGQQINIQTMNLNYTLQEVKPNKINKNIDIVIGAGAYVCGDETAIITLEEAEETARLLALREGIFCGPSSGAVFNIALQRIKKLEKGVMVAMIPDGGAKYLSTELCAPEKCLQCIKKYQIPCAYVDDKLGL
jgi:threonine synthase